MKPELVTNFREKVSKLRILVVGDLMLDRYLWGQVSRISPEAPVPVVDVVRTESRPGGAANVALNVAAMGAKVALCGVLGDDDGGRELLQHLRGDGFDVSMVQVTPHRITTTKTRVIGNKQQMMRVDHEVRESVSEEVTFELESAILGQLDQFDAVIFEDYDKGLLSESLIQTVTDAANRLGIPTVVDPKFRNFLCYRGTTLFKPNLKELNEALGIRVSKSDIPAILSAVRVLRGRMPHGNTLITLSEQGVLAVDENFEASHIPAHFRKITDVSGAGDTVVALMALCMAAGMGIPEAASVANLAGGLVCEEVGVAPVDARRLFEEMLKL